MLYPKTIEEYNILLSRFYDNNIRETIAVNPYWNENGHMFQDPDGYRIVISPLKATKLN